MRPVLISSAIALLTGCPVLLLPAADSEMHLASPEYFLGVAIMLIGLGMQVKVLALFWMRLTSQWHLFSGIFNIGIGAGARGRQSGEFTLVDVPTIGYVGAVPAAAAWIWSVIIFVKWPVSLEEQPPAFRGKMCLVTLTITGHSVLSVVLANFQHAVNNKPYAHTHYSRSPSNEKSLRYHLCRTRRMIPRNCATAPQDNPNNRKIIGGATMITQSEIPEP